jgi:hypothetical protein
MEELSFLQMPLPPGFELRLVDIAAESEIAYDPTAWDDALVVVEAGQVELECTAGGRRSFGTGAVMFLTGLPLRALHNRGPEPAVLAAVSRSGVGTPAQQEKTK